MIDTIKGYIDLSQYKHEDLEHLLNDGTINKSKKTFAFNLSNFRFTIKFDETQNPIKLLFNGSLSKFHHGNNLAQLDWETIEKVINELSDNLGINLNEAILTRIDVAVNLVLEKPINQYIHNFYTNKSHGILTFKDSKTFLSNTKDLTFYDKIKEIKHKENLYTKRFPVALETKMYLDMNYALKRI